MTRLTARYKEEAQFLLAGDFVSFVKGSRSEPDTMILSHPPGYPIVIAAIYKLSGNSDRALRLFQIACEAMTAVLVFLIAARLVPRGAALIAALLVAVAPQLAYRSLVLLPDTLSALPLVAAIFLVTKAVEDRGAGKMILAGGLIGVSAWLRADAVLLPIFLCAALLLLVPRGQWLRPALALIGGAMIAIAPIAIRNVVVFRSFVPITLGTGQNLSAGIADYDAEQRFGLPATDDGTCAQEAQLFGRSDYTAELYRPDGIERDRGRTARALAVIKSEPSWFVGTMFRRVAAMLEYEPVSIISAEPTVSHSLEITKDTPVVWSHLPDAPLLVTEPITVKKNTDYVLTVPVTYWGGRASITIKPMEGSRILASASLPESLQRVPYTNAYAPMVQMPFVNTNNEQVQVAIANEDSPSPRSNLDIGLMELVELGTASYLWTRYPRKLVKSVQKLFVTHYFLPLTIFGVALLAIYRRKVALVLLLTLPLYYLASHAPIHFEYRYILPVYFFWFILAGVAIYWSGMVFLTGITRFTRWFAERRALAIVCAIAIVTLASVPGRAQVPQSSALEARRELIISEASTSSANEWAGTYVTEDSPTSGARLDWAPVNGFVVWWSDCLPSWRDKVNFGSVDFRDGNLRVTPELGRDGEKVYALSRELIAVKWGEQHYLVPLDQLIAFCYAARNAGRSLEINEFFLRESDREKRRFGLPAVPSHYKKYLVGPPVQATIVDVKSQSQHALKAFSLNVGRKAGVVPGMKFFAIAPSHVYMLVEVTNVRDSDSDAYVITSGLRNKSGGTVQPQTGWKLTSRAPKRAYEYFPG